MELIIKISAIASILSFVLAFGIWLGGKLYKRREREEENLLHDMQAYLAQSAWTGKGNAWCPEMGSEGHRLAEKMVARGMLRRLTPGFYTVCGGSARN